MSIEDQIMSLNEGEFEVLYLKCKYQKNRVISERIGLTERGVVDRMARVYTKFGLKKGEEHWTKRMDYLHKEVCPKLPKNFKEWQKRKEDYTYRDTVEETVEDFVDGSVVGEETELISGVVKSKTVDEAPPDPEMVYLVMYDDIRITETAKEEPPLIIIHSEKLSLPVRVARYSLFGILVCLAITVVAYYAFKLGSGLVITPPSVQVTATFTATPPPSSTPAIMPEIVSTYTPTETSLPTLNPGFHLAGQWVDFSNGIYVRLNDDLYSMPDCRPLGDQFAVELQFHYEGGQYLVRYDSGAFHASDDTGKVYKLLGAGHIFCNEIGIQNVESKNRDIHITLLFEGAFPLEAKYLIITADSINGVKLVFHKSL